VISVGPGVSPFLALNSVLYEQIAGTWQHVTRRQLKQGRNRLSPVVGPSSIYISEKQSLPTQRIVGFI
jgi:hypothetical protein